MKAQQNGFSLIELLIAIAISMIAMVAATQVYVGTKSTSRLQAMQIRLSEDGRFGTSMIQRIIAQAGYRQTPSSNIATDRIGVASSVVTVKFRSDGDTQLNCSGGTPAAADQTLAIQRDATNDKLQCLFDSNADGVADTAVDWIAPANGGEGSEVVSFRVLMGIDTGPGSTNENLGCGTAAAAVKPRDCIADSYVENLTGGVTADQIVSIKVCWMLRSQATDASVTKSAAVQNCAGTDIPGSQNDRKLYRTFNTTVLLRNR